VRRADQILVLEAGRIIERGTHASLYAVRGRYFDLYTKQHGLESNLFLAPGEGSDESADAQDANGAAARGSGGGTQTEAAALPEAIRLIRGGSGS
jgi:subfamily B ATP-binding cassette protein MsbA